MPTEIVNPQLLRRLRLAGIIAGGLAIVIVVAGLVDRFFVSRAVANWTAEQLVPTVSVIKPATSGNTGTLLLPANLQAFYSAPIYARVPGYLRAWYQDIGAHVKKGQVLGVIETPDLDQQIEQAKGDLSTAVAALNISRITANRWSGLLKLDAVSKQETEEKTSDLQAKSAQVFAAKANLQRLNALKAFATLVAPFDGVVTARTVDVGALINVGAQSSPALFTVSDIHQIRVYVSVPQSYSSQIRPGTTATLSLPEYPGRSFTARLDTTADSISEKSNALLVEFLADNPDGALKPGGYAQAAIHLATAPHTVSIPASALIFNRHGLRVATVLSDDHIRMKPVTIERDLGTTVEISAGLSPGDVIVDNPPDSLTDHEVVHVQQESARTGNGP